MKIRIAQSKDIPEIMQLLRQVNDVHADGRPDLFRHGCTKYTEDELGAILSSEKTPVFAAVNDDDLTIGYCFCIIHDHSGSNNLKGIKTLYIDDLCVDENHRHLSIGREIYSYVREYAKRQGFYNITLNVWSCNPGATRFYESLNMHPMKIGMEEIL